MNKKNIIVSLLSLSLLITACSKDKINDTKLDSEMEKKIEQALDEKPKKGDSTAKGDSEVKKAKETKIAKKESKKKENKEESKKEAEKKKSEKSDNKKPQDKKEETSELAIDTSFVSGNTGAAESDVNYETFIFNNKQDIFASYFKRKEDQFNQSEKERVEAETKMLDDKKNGLIAEKEKIGATKTDKEEAPNKEEEDKKRAEMDNLIAQIDQEKSLKKTNPYVKPQTLDQIPDEDKKEIYNLIYSTIPNNTLVIGTSFFSTAPGGQERINQKNKEWVNISSKYTGNTYKYNGDGRSIYLAAHLSPYGKEIRNKSIIYYKDPNGVVAKYYLSLRSNPIKTNTTSSEMGPMIRGMYGNNAIIFQTCEPDGYNYRYYIFLPS